MSTPLAPRAGRGRGLVALGLAAALPTAAAISVAMAGTGVAAKSGDVVVPPGLGGDEQVVVPEAALEAPASVSTNDRVVRRAAGEAGVQRALATTTGSEIPAVALSAYQRAETVINAADASCNMSWQLLAAVGRVESDHGRSAGSSLDDAGVARPAIYGVALDGSTPGTATIRDTDAGQHDGDTRFDRAVGPMQFLPSTWASIGVDADGDGVRDPQDVDDAALAAAVYLCSGDEDVATPLGERSAVYRYNRSQSYVDLVLRVRDAYLRSPVATTAVTTASSAGSSVPGRTNPVLDVVSPAPEAAPTTLTARTASRRLGGGIAGEVVAASPRPAPEPPVDEPATDPATDPATGPGEVTATAKPAPQPPPVDAGEPETPADEPTAGPDPTGPPAPKPTPVDEVPQPCLDPDLEDLNGDGVVDELDAELAEEAELAEDELEDETTEPDPELPLADDPTDEALDPESDDPTSC